MKYLLLSWALIGMLAFAEAQQFQYRQYTTEEGLTHNQVFTIYEDTLGFMWFGTDDGLVRFDGQRFYDMRRVNSGFTGSFTLLQKAEGGGFWAGIYKKGLYKIMPGLQESYHEEFIEIPVGSDLIEEGDTLYSALAKSIYIRHSDSVHLLKFKGWFNRIFSDLGPSETRLSVLVNRLFITPQGKRRFLNGFGLFNFEDAQISGDGILVADSDLNKTILNCYEANDEYSYWLGGKGELYLYRDHQIAATLTHPAWKDKELHFIYKDSQENLWISVRDAGVFLKPLHGEIRFVGDEIGLKDEFANFIYEDRNQVLWFATTNNGVFRVEKNPYERVEIAQGAVKVNALGMSNAQELLVGANRQIYKFSSSGERLALLSSVMRGEVQSFHSRKGHTYASIFIESTDGRGDAAIEISPGLFAITASNTTFLNDSTLLMWFGGLTTKDNKLIGQLSVWDIDEQGALSIARSYRYPDKIPWRTFNTNGSLYNPDGSIWVALNKGLYYWDSIPDFEKEPVLPFESKDVIRLPDGRILFATINGLYVSDGKKDARLAAFFEGVSSSCMSFDQEQRLWVGSNEGLYVFEFNGEEILVKAQLGKGLNINCLLFEEDANTLWFGTDQGLYKLKTDAAELKASVIPQIQITELITEDSTYLFPQDVVIPSDNNYIRFQFSGLEFQNPRSLEIAYRLNGLSWQEIRSQELQLAALADGDYLLELKASNDGFNWSEIESVHFQISPPLWKSPWFYALVSTLAVLLIGFLAWRRVINVKRREREKRYLQKKLTELEQQALGAMMNPHFIFNTLNSIQHFFNQHDTADANEYLARFAQLIRLNMEVVQKPLTPLDEELDRLQIYLDLEQLRFGDKMSYQLEVSLEIDTEEIMIPAMLMQPFVENAIWHGIAQSKTKGWVHVQLKMLDEDTLRIRIDDNGPGVFSSQFVKKSAHTSRGVEITRSRLHHYSPKASLIFSERKSELGEVLGTQVELRLPV